MGIGRGNGVIRTPWKLRWQRFRYTWVPGLTFVLLLVVVGTLWQRQDFLPNSVGRVEATRANVASVVDGQLMPLDELPEGRWRLFDPVEPGQVVARLNDKPLRALLAALQSDAAALRAELDAAKVTTARDNTELQFDHVRGSTDAAWQFERTRLDVLDRLALVEEDRLELSRLESRLQTLTKARGSGLVSESEIDDVRGEIERVTALLDAHRAAVRQAEQNSRSAAERADNVPALVQPEIDKLLAPIRASIEAAEARAEEVSAQIEMMEIRSPVRGTIAAIYIQPGQAVQAGEWIMTIAADEADHITAYVRPEQHLRPAANMPVGVRPRLPGQRLVASTVQSVGSQWEALPLELLRDQRIPEWVLPVRIALPDGLEVRPGEIVDVCFIRSDSMQEDRASN